MRAAPHLWRNVVDFIYPIFNKTSLSRKPCNVDKKLVWITMTKSCSLFQNPSWKIAWSAPWRRTDDDVISGRQYILVVGNHASQIKSYNGSLWRSHVRSFSIRREKSREAPPGGVLTMTMNYVFSSTVTVFVISSVFCPKQIRRVLQY